ncbi:FAD-binding oxidoreductase [Methylosinus sp. PW1]|uniref:FAD-binding oxidoreductase n=1 Tax=Methylosinus sp. PW1 TaxID=107636 RepID=UPI000568CE68|nr:FAD-binding oxidoreductase [Methylosinus sp. PW1]
MEHPLRLEEYSSRKAPPTAAVEDEIALPLAKAAAAPLPPLPSLPASEVQFLRPPDPHYADFLPAVSKRKQLAPALRAICKTEHAVAVMVDWVRSNGLNFATRSGGHSYEGLSQTTGIAIDVRGLKRLAVDKASEFVTVGSGVSLFELYSGLAAQGLALQAGSCPTVGVSGHLTGGGHGLLARSHGLTCDALLDATLVDGQGRVLQANAFSQPNLYWACRGGGGGSFGVVTEFKIQVFALKSVLVFGVSWKLSRADAARLFAAWQDWAPNAPSGITSIMKVGPAGNGLIGMRCIGQSVGDERELRNELRRLTSVLSPSTRLSVRMLAFLDAVKHFAGPLVYESLLMKAKSDYVLKPLSEDGIGAMMAALAPIVPGGIVLLCDSYGGKIADIAPDATAFPRRAGTQYCIQYFTSWGRSADTPVHLAQIARVYATMRPFMFGASYVNYSDLDLGDYASAYWGDNLARLVAVKQQYDPNDLFHHAQSVPLSVPTV